MTELKIPNDRTKITMNKHDKSSLGMVWLVPKEQLYNTCQFTTRNAEFSGSKILFSQRDLMLLAQLGQMTWPNKWRDSGGGFSLKLC